MHNIIDDVIHNSFDYKEALADICYQLGLQQVVINNDSRAFITKAIEWADEFDKAHEHTDWNETDYIDTIYRFTQSKIAGYQGLIYHNCPYCGHDIMSYDRDDNDKTPYLLTCQHCNGEITGTEATYIFSESEKVPLSIV